MSDKEENEKEAPVISTQVKTSGLLSNFGNLSSLLGNLGNLGDLISQAQDGDGQPVITQGGFTGSVKQWSEKRGVSVPEKDTWKPRTIPSKPMLERERPIPSPELEMFDEVTEYVITGVCPGYDQESFACTLENSKLVITATDYNVEFDLPDAAPGQLEVRVENGLFLCRIPKRETSDDKE